MRRGIPYQLLAFNAALLGGLAIGIGALSATVSQWVAPSLGVGGSSAPSGLPATLVAWRGPALFFFLTAWLALLATLAAPAAGARSVGGERAAGTLDQLVVGGTPTLGIVLGKGIGALVLLWLALGSALPSFALVWLFGGVPPRTVALTLLLLATYSAALVVLGALAGALGRGELVPTAIAGGAAALLLIGTLAGVVPGVLPVRLATALAAANPLAGLLGANPELAEAIGKSAVGWLGLPLRPTTVLLGKTLSAPLPVVGAAGWLFVALLLLPCTAVALEPYHRFKTVRLRRGR